MPRSINRYVRVKSTLPAARDFYASTSPTKHQRWQPVTGRVHAACRTATAPGGLPTSQSVNQWDLSLGGRILRDKVWFFATYRYADLQNGISRTPTDLQYLTAFKPTFEPFDSLDGMREASF